MSEVEKNINVDHDLKIWPQYFEDIKIGAKRFELRKEDDRTFHIGDVVMLREFDPEKDQYTGRSVTGMINYVLRDCPEHGLADGYCIFCLKDFDHQDTTVPMETYRGVKIFKVGDSDWVYAPNEVEAKEVMVQISGKEYVEEITEDDPIAPISQSDFDNGTIHYFKETPVGTYDDHDAPLVPFKECLDHILDTIPRSSGHFMTTEF